MRALKRGEAGHIDDCGVSMRWMMLLSAVLLCSGCEQVSRGLERLLKWRAGVEEQLLVIADAPFEMGPDGSVFPAREPVRAFDRTRRLCVVLANGERLDAASKVDQLFRRLTNGGVVAGALVLESGARLPLARSSQDWSLEGQLGGRDEVSACVSLDGMLPPDDPVASFELSASRPFRALGAYWHSESEPVAAKRND